jgi:hypothetical protein
MLADARRAPVIDRQAVFRRSSLDASTQVVSFLNAPGDILRYVAGDRTT